MLCVNKTYYSSHGRHVKMAFTPWLDIYALLINTLFFRSDVHTNHDTNR